MGPIEVKALILLAAVAVGGLSIFWGYRLFKLGRTDPGTTHGQFGDWKISLRNYGPGVVFCLFGAAIIAFAVTRDLSQTTTTTTKKTIRPPSEQTSGDPETVYFEETAVAADAAAASADTAEAESAQ